MGRFDDILNQREADATEARRKQQTEKASGERILEEKKREYYSVISKYLEEFSGVLPRLQYNRVVEVKLLGLVSKKVKVRKINPAAFIDPGELCYDSNGNWYRVENYVSYRYAEVIPPAKKLTREETVEAIFDKLPWKECLPYWEGKLENNYGGASIISYMISGNADEAVALFFEGLMV